jgi:hypothetical protein
LCINSAFSDIHVHLSRLQLKCLSDSAAAGTLHWLLVCIIAAPHCKNESFNSCPIYPVRLLAELSVARFRLMAMLNSIALELGSYSWRRAQPEQAARSLNSFFVKFQKMARFLVRLSSVKRGRQAFLFSA